MPNVSNLSSEFLCRISNRDMKTNPISFREEKNVLKKFADLPPRLLKKKLDSKKILEELMVLQNTLIQRGGDLQDKFDEDLMKKYDDWFSKASDFLMRNDDKFNDITWYYLALSDKITSEQIKKKIKVLSNDIILLLAMKGRIPEELIEQYQTASIMKSGWN